MINLAIQMIETNQIKKIRFKTMLQSDLCDTVIHILLSKKLLLSQEQIIEIEKISLKHLKTMHHIIVVYQRSIMY